MKLIISHPTANNCSRAIVKKLKEEHVLYEFHTTIASFPGDRLDRIGALKIFSDIQRRRFDLELKPYIRTWPWLELGRQIFSKVGIDKFSKHETGFFSVDAVYRSLDKRVASKLNFASGRGVSGVYAYEDGAIASFTKAKDLKLKCIYDLPIAYWETGRKLMGEESVRLPQWAITMGGGIQDSTIKLEQKTRELELADVVVVPGRFVKESLPPWANGKKVIVAPFGSPEVSVQTEHVKNKEKVNRPLRVLFAGSMGQRKGLGDLFTAIKLLNHSNVELVVMGSLLAPMRFYKSQLSNFTYEMGRPHDQVLALMRTCDVFCLPSIVEGRALVMQEAMSQGLPLIITPNTGGADLIIEGQTGFLVPIRSPKAIAEKISWFLDNRLKIPEMAKMAQEHAARYTWENYGDQIIESLKN